MTLPARVGFLATQVIRENRDTPATQVHQVIRAATQGTLGFRVSLATLVTQALRTLAQAVIQGFLGQVVIPASPRHLAILVTAGWARRDTAATPA